MPVRESEFLRESLLAIEKLDSIIIKGFNPIRNPPISDSRITDLEKKHNLNLPDILKSIFLIFNGEKPEDFPGLIYNARFLSCEEAIDIQSDFIKQKDEGIWKDILLEKDDRLIYSYPCPQVTPFIANYNGGYLGIDSEPSQIGKLGQIVYYGGNCATPKVIYDSLIDFLADVLKNLHENKYLLVHRRDKSDLPTHILPNKNSNLKSVDFFLD